MPWRLFAAVLFTGLSILFSHWPQAWQNVLERLYGGVIYPEIQRSLQHLPILANVALADLLWVVIPVLFVIRLAWLLRKHKVRRLPNALLIAWLWASGFYVLIMLMWGLNYHRPSLYQSLLAQGFTRQLQDEQWQFALSQTQVTLNNLPGDFNYCPADISLNPNRPAAFVHSAMALADMPTSPARTVQSSAWSFYYRGIGLAGVYIPLTGEPTYNRYLFPLAKPFTMMHEYAHWTGSAPEYDADIIAYWSSWMAPDPLWQYSAWLAWWREINAPANVVDQLDDRVKQSLTCYADYQRQQKRWKIADLHWRVYQQTLKSQGIQEGLRSYSMGESLALTSYQRWLLVKQHLYDHH
ncbi:MAG: DUF3810 family protein [Reinekea sp.]|jgi:hypothetical protein